MSTLLALHLSLVQIVRLWTDLIEQQRPFQGTSFVVRLLPYSLPNTGRNAAPMIYR